jgi:hypothetical protein
VVVEVLVLVAVARGMEKVEDKLEEGTRGEAAVGMAITEAGGMALGEAAGHKPVVKDLEEVTEMVSEGTEGMGEMEGRDKGKGTGIATQEEGLVNSRDIRQDQEHQEHQEGGPGLDRDIPISSKGTGKDRVKGSRVASTVEGRDQDTTRKADTVRAVAAAAAAVGDGDSVRMRRARRMKGSILFNPSMIQHCICLLYPSSTHRMRARVRVRIWLSSDLVFGEKLRE